MHTGLALALGQPVPVLAAGATKATFKINTAEGVKGDVVFELYPDKVCASCVQCGSARGSAQCLARCLHARAILQRHRYICVATCWRLLTRAPCD